MSEPQAWRPDSLVPAAIGPSRRVLRLKERGSRWLGLILGAKGHACHTRSDLAIKQAARCQLGRTEAPSRPRESRRRVPSHSAPNPYERA
jgi:hypothetical protein